MKIHKTYCFFSVIFVHLYYNVRKRKTSGAGGGICFSCVINEHAAAKQQKERQRRELAREYKVARKRKTSDVGKNQRSRGYDFEPDFAEYHRRSEKHR